MMRMPLRAALLASLGLASVVLASVVLAPAARAQSPGGTARGEYLARAGDCVACHSAPGGKAFAGGLKMGTPLGAIFATNITPDVETGIGTYTLQDFDRAVRRGVAKDGRHLYPAMPYPSYAKLTAEDVRALYDYFMRAVPPVHQVNQPSRIPVYLSLRWPLAIWNALFVGRHRLHRRPAEGRAVEPRRLPGRGPRPLRRMSHGARLGIPGKIARCRQPGLPFRARFSTAGTPSSLRQDLATGLGRLVAGRDRRIPQDRPRPAWLGLWLDAGCHQQQHALSDRR